MFYLRDRSRRVCGSLARQSPCFQGYIVHGTVRNPNLLDYEAIVEAIAGCEGVFHVASPVPSTAVPNPEVEVIKPAVEGILNVLKACCQAVTSRVVYVSSVAAVSMNRAWTWKPSLMRIAVQTRSISGLLRTGIAFPKPWERRKVLAMQRNMDLTVCPSVVIGPLLQPTVNSSSLFLINILKGCKDPIENSLFHIVDVHDVADALLLVYEKNKSSGRYISAPNPLRISNLIDILKSMYTDYNFPKEIIDARGVRLSSEKLKMLGWKCRDLKYSLVDSIQCHKEAGLIGRD